MKVPATTKVLVLLCLMYGITYIDRVKTPVMIIGADQDYVTITQGEQFFTALHRQGKPAKFLRYWGDGHVLESRGNVQHMWGQVFEWFDRYVANSGGEQAPSR